MSISLMKDRKLWGLIACHHYSPRYVSYEVRKACEFLGQVMSLELANKENNENYDYQIELKSIQVKVLEYMSTAKDFIDGLVNYQPNLLDLVDARGAAVYFAGNYTVVGETPEKEDIRLLIEWLEKSDRQEIFYTNSLAKIYPEAEKFKDIASGFLAISLSPTQKNYILWFRPEVIQTVNWAGNPHQPMEMDEEKLRFSPRKSFELWKENVRLKSLPWKKCELEAALELRNAAINIVLRNAEELAKLNAALQKSEAQSRERAIQLAETLHALQNTQTQLIHSEKMSSLGQLVAGVAHEINNPINFIYGNLSHANDYTKDLIGLIDLYERYYPSPEATIQAQAESIDLEFLIADLPKLLSSMKVGADRIRQIVESLRNFSRLDEAEMKPVDIHEGINSTLLILQHRLKPKHDAPGIEIIKEYGNLPYVDCYAGQLNQVFVNLIANAIDALEGSEVKQLESAKESSHKPTILIRTEVIDREQVAIRIIDNGLGISEEVQHQMFDPFFTTKPVGKGTGIGLAICYQIVVEKHRGQLRCISTPGKGAEFVIEIPTSPTIARG